MLTKEEYHELSIPSLIEFDHPSYKFIKETRGGYYLFKHIHFHHHILYKHVMAYKTDELCDYYEEVCQGFIIHTLHCGDYAYTEDGYFHFFNKNNEFLGKRKRISSYLTHAVDNKKCRYRLNNNECVSTKVSCHRTLNDVI